MGAEAGSLTSNTRAGTVRCSQVKCREIRAAAGSLGRPVRSAKSPVRRPRSMPSPLLGTLRQTPMWRAVPFHGTLLKPIVGNHIKNLAVSVRHCL